MKKIFIVGGDGFAREWIGEINLGNDLIFCEKIYTINSVESNDLKSKIEKILQGFL